MNKLKFLLYGAVWCIFLILLHIYFPSSWPSLVKRAIDAFFSNPLRYWWFVFPFAGLLMLVGLILYYGIHFLASFGRGFIPKEFYYPKISIMIASKNEKQLLERTMNSIIKSDYPKEMMQIIIITSGSTDDSEEFCLHFAEKYRDLDIEILSKDLPKKGKPTALNYGLQYVKNEIVILYDSGCILQRETLKYLVAPFFNDKSTVVIGPVLVKNWKKNKLTRGIVLDYAMVSGGGLLFEIKNRLGSSAYSFGRNLAIPMKYLRKYGGFNENSMTEDLYLSVLLNLDDVIIRFSPKAKIYEYVPNKWDILVKQRSRWLAGFIYDMPQLMQMKSEKKNGKSIIISRNMTMMVIGNMDTWIPIVIAFMLIFWLFGELYLFFWSFLCLFSQLGFLIQAIRKYGDKHYSVLFFFAISAYIHLFMFLYQFSLPKEMSWEKTPMLFEKETEEIVNLSIK
jgi:cellulose synthase/poly-beta-1,6-N-acetylglucosamine synthase-like glycosyltransferase